MKRRPAGPDWKGGGVSKDEWREIIACGMDAVRQRAVSKAGEELAEDPLADPQVDSHTLLFAVIAEVGPEP
jgi:hypothetical protein